MLIPFTLSVDIFSEIDRIMRHKYQLYIVDETETELKRIIKKQKAKYANAARFAQKLIKEKNIKKIKQNINNVDKAIIHLTNKDGYIVATQDRELKKKLKSTSVIVLRQKNHLVLLEP